MRLFGWYPPRRSLVDKPYSLIRYMDDPDDRFRAHVQDVASEWFHKRLTDLDAEIAELRGMMARHKIVDQRKPQQEECVWHGPSGNVTYTAPIKDRRGRKT